jgi:hypothetical protein
MVEQKKSVLIVGIDPVLIDFSSPDFAPYDLSAERVLSAIRADSERLRGLGYEADTCLTDFGESAERVLEEKTQGEVLRLRADRSGHSRRPQQFSALREAHKCRTFECTASEAVLQYPVNQSGIERCR